ncbi:putative repeat protein (TIGR01451 family) [Kribbella amoyensis]|uniref:Putative repeat protein (TIGR01451 family) n=1 Tax=Kribbella amoyensis TaxID=996641 RepID=A0A561BZQ9_9ACTN|nr:hypothetical protein [Kribbella amoyensis]TWD84162.1 putative repeat protein (TIGR01451 family) [Kribbella amoyensis]
MRKYLLPLVALAAIAAPTPSAAVEAPPGAAQQVIVELDRTEAAIGLGQTITFTSAVRNTGEQELTGAIAHLNIFAVDPGVYVDPEDWSSERTQYLDPLGGGDTDKLEWEMQAVNSGHFVVYVALGTGQAAAPVVSSKALRLDIAPERTLGAGGVLPIAAGVPGVIAVLMMLAMLRRRQLRPKSTEPSQDAGS